MRNNTRNNLRLAIIDYFKGEWYKREEIKNEIERYFGDVCEYSDTIYSLFNSLNEEGLIHFHMDYFKTDYEDQEEVNIYTRGYKVRIDSYFPDLKDIEDMIEYIEKTEREAKKVIRRLEMIRL